MNRPYVIGFRADALRDLQNLGQSIAERVLQKLLWFSRFVEDAQHEALTGSWKGFYRYRIGDHRVIYRLERGERLIIVEVIGHRRNVYDE